MLFNLPDYILSECLYEGRDTIIYRVRKKADFSSAIVKKINAEYPTLEEIARLRHEYKILRILEHVPGIIKTYGLENNQNDFALILEDGGGISLQQILAADKIPVRTFLHIGIQLVEIIGEIHKHNIIHKDINPQNILIDLETWTVKLIDFSIASRLSKEVPAISNPENLEGTLAYISPEQTGRMNRAVDYRTDFYSLGATFYQMLTGQLPFTTTDALELVHCHIAKNPVPPHQVCAEIPIAVSDIVMKLMAKTAEERYQSALGLKHDLEICWRQLELNGEIAHFTPGKLDQSGQFLIPQKLYGRVDEVRILLEAFDRVSAGSSELMLVSGYSGIGKTSVVNEVHKAIVQQRGYFIAGKFDQLKRNIPYAALIQACQTLIEQLLTETDEEIERWKQALLAALENNGQALIDMIPEVEHIIGSQPSIPQLDAAANQNRFNRVFQQFIRAFATAEHPLVVFLDDLQWADLASIKLIGNILCDGDTHHLLLIGAYRDNEVSPTHPTVIAIKNIEQAGAVVNHIVLQPLSLAHASELMCDTLGESLKFEVSSSPDGIGVRMRSLMRLVYNKTQGNPFFLTQLLQTLHSEQLLHFDFERGEWAWEIEQIQAVGITDLNVVELAARNIQKLSEETQQVLKLAACMGNQFNLDTLTIISEQSLLDTANKLWDALQAGLIIPLSQSYKIPLFVDDAEQKAAQFNALTVSYKFLHDRIQQAAYSLIPDEQKKTTHLKIGQLLLQKTPESAIEDNIFDIVNQLNIGVELITNYAEKEQIAALNLIAGRKAKAATAYEAAVRYLSVGLGLLTASSWQSNYDLTLNLHVEAVEAEYIITHYDRAKELADIVL
ncbi:MAG TPA: hypothetical protein DDW76_06725 [Cyanobacteria bacterium UBA11369]|nr:hypothetical protein [Cyanobacteria bacterium UBA11371]HBE32023.1 hypothetical protein [Cyanobacteria bacterium UBA11368]HBE48495.1 hypothetical protein [Cyanobacteria bacterium UBA11369]